MITTYLQGLALGSATFGLGALLDHTLDNETRMNMKAHEPSLYTQMYRTSFLNLVVLAPFYFVSIAALVSDATETTSVPGVLGVLASHGVWYYLAHCGMHVVDALKPLHRFHHRYKKHVVPSVGNAVTVGEMFFAYLTPFVVHCAAFRPAMGSMISGIAVISFFNLVVHSTALTKYHWYPPGMVSPAMHITHHNLYLRHFAAPIVDLDGVCASITRCLLLLGESS